MTMQPTNPPRPDGVPNPAYGTPQWNAGAPQQQMPQPPAYDYGGAQQPAYPVSPPGRTLSIVGFILAFLVPVIGCVLCIIGLVTSKRAGASNPLALWGLILSIVFTVMIVVGFVISIVTTMSVAGSLLEKCAELGPGVHVDGNTTITCS